MPALIWYPVNAMYFDFIKSTIHGQLWQELQDVLLCVMFLHLMPISHIMNRMRSFSYLNHELLALQDS